MKRFLGSAAKEKVRRMMHALARLAMAASFVAAGQPPTPQSPQYPPRSNPPHVPPASARPNPPAPAPMQPAPANQWDQAMRLLDEASRTFQGVRDYSCTFIKRETVQGRLQPDNVIAMRVRNQPFSVYMRWLAPKQSVGQEVCYVAGRNNNQMRVHSPGILGAVGFVSIDPRDPRAMQASRHPITEAGLGNLLARLRQGWEWERQVNRTQVRVAEYEFNRRRCTRVELIHPERINGFYSYRTVVYFDNEHHLPVRFEAYSWPVAGGTPGGDLDEVYSYLDLRFNLGLGEEQFRY